MPSLDAAYASLLQAAYTIGMRDGITVALDHVPPHVMDGALQAMLADRSSARGSLAGRTELIDEIAELQKEIAAAIEAGEASRN